ncbi:hypothetical protein [Sinorhizobium meliloti]|uniref:hypothetical protein n=1 Tax=Rhizobium meliloti TaxID=382 RepID=UPI00299E38B7|nr:hypothetical protein [Sinorhizobium meliloti]MDW9692130.1 hypothetical protein [Sinorhizobium meliloti]MDW9715822.1 hypothetical protein [Sinorhizobium meliloti]MDW9752694.1 hypothetical protein [Sinorhizobium meliloti]
MPKPNPPKDERLNVKLLFGLLDCSASGPFAVKAVVVLVLLAMVGRAAGLL